jgi:hypothetical protein
LIFARFEPADKHDSLDARLQDLDNVTDDKFEGLSKALTSDRDELGKAAEKETGSEMNP